MERREGPGAGPLTGEERRWLHDKYQRLAEHEAQLADYRTSYFAAIEAALVAAQVLLVINLLRAPPVFATVSTLLALFGLLVCGVWALVLHRTTAAMLLWREGATRLEAIAPPVPGPIDVTVEIGHRRAPLSIDLTRPFQAHQHRFGGDRSIPWADSIRPTELWGDIPLILAGAWGVVIAVVWFWFLAFGGTPA